jgi:hypothetical protein
MKIGTTPTHTFTLPDNIDDTAIKEIEISYSQKGSVILTKKTNDCALSDRVITVKLTQQDTFAFNPSLWVEIQVRLLTNAGDAMGSDIFKCTAEKCLSSEVLK